MQDNESKPTPDAVADPKITEAEIDEALRETFPAGDAPFWTLGARSSQAQTGPAETDAESAPKVKND